MKLKKVISMILATTMMLSIVMPSSAAGSYEAPTTGFEGDSELSMDLVGRYTSGQVNFDGGVMEIIAYNTANGYSYAINGVSGNIAIIQTGDLTGTEFTNLTGVEFDVQKAVEEKDSSFNYGDMTSIAISPDQTTLAVALQDDDHDKVGRVATFTFGNNGSLTLKDVITVGIQPDMVTFADDNTVLTADEAEPDVVGGKYVDPAGSVSIVDLESKTATVAGFEAFDNTAVRASLINQGVMFKADADASLDFEPEYITVVGETAYVSLQEANAIAVVDIEKKEISDVYGLGFIDLGEVAFDINDEDEVYAPALHEGVYSVRMPDAIDSYEVDGKTYIVTANEGDGREYGDEDEDAEFYCNEIKVKFHKKDDAASPNGNMTAEVYGKDGLGYGTVLFIDPTTVDALNNNTYDYMYGGRGFTIFEVTDSGLKVAYEVGNEIEALTAQYLPDYFNTSNDNNKIEDRSGKKGAEVETVKIGEVDGETYAFVALERISGIMVYNISDPTSAEFINYINTRDFDDVLGNPEEEIDEDTFQYPAGEETWYDYDDGELDHYITGGDIAPEGLAFVSAENSPNGYPMLLTSNEVSGTVTAIKLGNTQYVAPTPDDDKEETTVPDTTTPDTTTPDTTTPDTTTPDITTPDTSISGDNPKTGDNNGLMAIMVIMLMSAGFVATTIKKRGEI